MSLLSSSIGLVALCQNESSRETMHMEMCLLVHFPARRTHFLVKGFVTEAQGNSKMAYPGKGRLEVSHIGSSL